MKTCRNLNTKTFDDYRITTITRITIDWWLIEYKMSRIPPSEKLKENGKNFIAHNLPFKFHKKVI